MNDSCEINACKKGVEEKASPLDGGQVILGRLSTALHAGSVQAEDASLPALSLDNSKIQKNDNPISTSLEDRNPSRQQVISELDKQSIGDDARMIALEFDKALRSKWDNSTLGKQFIELIKNYSSNPQFKEGVDAINKAYEAFDMHYDLGLNANGDLSFARNRTFFIDKINWQKHREEVQKQEEVAQVTEPNPFKFFDKLSIKNSLTDWKTLSLTLSKNFGTWDKDGDGLLLPSELNKVFTNTALSVEERIAAASVRVAYQQLRTMDFQNECGDPDYFDKKDAFSIAALHDSQKRAEITEALYENFQKRVSRGRDSWWEFQPYELFGLWLLREFKYPKVFQQMADQKTTQLDSLPKTLGL